MKKFLFLGLFLALGACSIAQTTANFPADKEKAFGLIKNGAFKNGYKYLITFADVNHAAINVDPNTGYLIFFVYDNTNHPQTDFKAYLMTPDSTLKSKYTARPFDRAQVGAARGAQLEFKTKTLGGATTRPVKLEAKPQATIYVFYKK